MNLETIFSLIIIFNFIGIVVCYIWNDDYAENPKWIKILHWIGLIPFGIMIITAFLWMIYIIY